MVKPSDIEKLQFAGCLLGGAVGDALGYPIEFKDAVDIFQKYGERGLTEYVLHNNNARISDDTQMTLFTAEGLLFKGKSNVIESIHRSYLNWLETQKHEEPISNKGLLYVKELYQCRFPGNTCLDYLESGKCGTLENRINNKKGCGGIMRVAPIALYYHNSPLAQSEIDLIGARASAITHGHPLGFIPAAMLVHIISLVLRGNSIIDAVSDAKETVQVLFKEYESDVRYQIELIDKAISLTQKKMHDLDAITELGYGWVAEETLAISVYCALKYSNDFEKCIVAAVNHSGDSDSTGSVAGNILGAHLGVNKIPNKYLSTLELKDLIHYIALKLCHERPW